ncbi:hypothetical protein R1A27_18135 [Methylobacterium sp. NMS12]|uniref:hypothetical protein n=1 Tax=Methylobacterium sp. NMS12 TaxID=3079766 RepID=UPI003F882A45
MTSIYRQLGIGCERLFRAVVQDQLGLSDSEVRWGYDVEISPGKMGRLTLDARIDRSHLADQSAVTRLDSWLSRASEYVGLGSSQALTGVVFEVRQGYKSADSKRQNADLRFGMRARSEGYMPVVLVMSNQVSATVAQRYRNSNMLILTGVLSDDDRLSTFAFCNDVLGYSLTDFFKRNTSALRTEVAAILSGLLSPTS